MGARATDVWLRLFPCSVSEPSVTATFPHELLRRSCVTEASFCRDRATSTSRQAPIFGGLVMAAAPSTAAALLDSLRPKGCCRQRSTICTLDLLNTDFDIGFLAVAPDNGIVVTCRLSPSWCPHILVALRAAALWDAKCTFRLNTTFALRAPWPL